MPSTYSTSLKLELIGNGEQAGAWGTTTNNNLGTLLEQAITGVLPLTIYGDTTLTNYNGLSDQARNAVLFLTGNLTSSANVIAPSGQQKVYIVRNRTGNTVNMTTGSGSNVSIANAASEVVFTDGTNFYSATQFNYINGNLTVSNDLFVGGNASISGKVTLSSDVFGNVNTGQWYLPTGNTAARTANATAGVIRYNSEANFYEGYANGSWVRFLVANEGSYTITYVAIGGGGGGLAGGGGAGKFVSSTTPAIPGTTTITITIGAGGASAANGSDTVITGIASATGGGAGLSGGSSGVVSGGTSGNGYSGGTGYTGGTGGASGGGGGSGGVGGGAGASGGDQAGGAGGAGTETLITGTSQFLAGGGGGGAQGPGGAGTNGGGNGWGQGAGAPSAGTVNTGGGGGGYIYSGANGGSGVVYLSMPTIYYTGTFTGSPTVTTTGSNTVLKYTGSGTYTA
jgi:hypothetical protein